LFKYGYKSGLSSDYYDVRRTRYSPLAVTEVKEGSTLAPLANQCLGCCWKDGCCWTSEQRKKTDNIDQNAPNTNKNKQIGRYAVLNCSFQQILL